MKSLELPGALHTLVLKAFTAAKKSESLVFSHTELAIIHTRKGVPVSHMMDPMLGPQYLTSYSSNYDTVQH